MDSLNSNYSVWIEAEEWPEGEWTPMDDNSDVIVTLENGDRWMATFFSYQNILSLSEKNRQSGECLNGKYFAAKEMILVDEVSRYRIEEVVADLISENDLKSYFSRCDAARSGAD